MIIQSDRDDTSDLITKKNNSYSNFYINQQYFINSESPKITITNDDNEDDEIKFIKEDH
jgi:hypothetical protein